MIKNFYTFEDLICVLNMESTINFWTAHNQYVHCCFFCCCCQLNDTDISSVYLSYEQINNSMGYDEPTARPKSSRPKSSRPKTAGRPKTGKK